jgi:hypothetical protein
VAAYCPPETAIASPQTFRTKTTLRQGERPFQTVKRFRLAEKKKNDDGARLMETYAKCRATTDEAIAKHNAELEKQRKNATSGILAGGI